MPYFKWSAIDLSGRLVQGSSEELTEYDLTRALLHRDLGLLKARRMRWCSWYKPVRLQHIIEYLSYLNTLLRAGVHLDKALLLSEKHIKHTGFSKYIHEIRMHIQQGSSLAYATQQYPELFSDIVCAAIAAGHESGCMTLSLSLLVDYLEMIEQFYKKIRTAAFLPLLTFLFFIVICMVIINVVLPTFATTFSSFGQELPMSLSFLLGFSTIFTGYNCMIFLCTGFLLSVSCKRVLKKVQLQSYVYSIVCSLPIIRSITLRMIRVRFLTELALLLKSGRSLIQALSILDTYNSWAPFKCALANVIEHVSSGKPLYQACEHYERFFPHDVRALLAVGHESGDLSSMLERAAQMQREQLSKRLDVLSVSVQPLMMIILGILVTGLIIIVYYPLLNSALTIGDNIHM